VFAEPCQAQEFALAVKLSDREYSTCKEWTQALGKELREAVDRGEPDDGSHYYHHRCRSLPQLAWQAMSAGTPA